MAGENEYSVNQSSNIRPPRVGQIIALAVDATSRGYDISQLKWNGVPIQKIAQHNHFFLSIQCETNDVYFAFDQAAAGLNSIDDTSAIAAAGTMVTPAITSVSAAPDYIPTLTAAAPPAHLVGGLPPIDVRIDHLVDKTLIVKCAAGKTATLRMWPSSQNEPAADR